MSRDKWRTRLLRRRVKALRAENRRLRRSLAAMGANEGCERDHAGDALPQTVRERFHRIADSGRRLALRGYPAYLLACLRATSLWSFWQRLLRTVRRYRLLTALLRGVLLVAAWLETGAFVLLYTAFFLLTVPVLLVGGMILLLIGFFQHRRCNAALSGQLAGRRVIVCFADRTALTDSAAYFAGMVRDFAARPDTAVVVVSPFFFSGRGFGDRRAYLTLRRATGRAEIYLIRRHYYFSLRRHVLDVMRDRVILLH